MGQLAVAKAATAAADGDEADIREPDLGGWGLLVVSVKGERLALFVEIEEGDELSGDELLLFVLCPELTDIIYGI